MRRILTKPLPSCIIYIAKDKIRRGRRQYPFCDGSTENRRRWKPGLRKRRISLRSCRVKSLYGRLHDGKCHAAKSSFDRFLSVSREAYVCMSCFPMRVVSRSEPSSLHGRGIFVFPPYGKRFGHANQGYAALRKQRAAKCPKIEEGELCTRKFPQTRILWTENARP